MSGDRAEVHGRGSRKAAVPAGSVHTERGRVAMPNGNYRPLAVVGSEPSGVRLLHATAVVIEGGSPLTWLTFLANRGYEQLCAQAVKTGGRVSDQVVEIHRVLNLAMAEVRRVESDTGHDDSARFGVDGSFGGEDLIGSREAAEVLLVSKRQVQRLAPNLGGRLAGGRWVFDRAAVEAYASDREQDRRHREGK